MHYYCICFVLICSGMWWESDGQLVANTDNLIQLLTEFCKWFSLEWPVICRVGRQTLLSQPFSSKWCSLRFDAISLWECLQKLSCDWHSSHCYSSRLLAFLHQFKLFWIFLKDLCMDRHEVWGSRWLSTCIFQCTEMTTAWVVSYTSRLDNITENMQPRVLLLIRACWVIARCVSWGNLQRICHCQAR